MRSVDNHSASESATALGHANRRCLLYQPEFHNSVEFDDGHGQVKVDAAIFPILVDLKRLPFIKETLASCSGGSGDGAGDQRALAPYDEKSFSWYAHIAFRLDTHAAAGLHEAQGFLKEIQAISLQTETSQGMTESRVVLVDAPGQMANRSHTMSATQTLMIVYDRKLPINELSHVTDLTWQELHSRILKQLAAGGGQQAASSDSWQV